MKFMMTNTCNTFLHSITSNVHHMHIESLVRIGYAYLISQSYLTFMPNHHLVVTITLSRQIDKKGEEEEEAIWHVVVGHESSESSRRTRVWWILSRWVGEANCSNGPSANLRVLILVHYDEWGKGGGRYDAFCKVAKFDANQAEGKHRLVVA